MEFEQGDALTGLAALLASVILQRVKSPKWRSRTVFAGSIAASLLAALASSLAQSATGSDPDIDRTLAGALLAVQAIYNVLRVSGVSDKLKR